jgi:hypothetical protein
MKIEKPGFRQTAITNATFSVFLHHFFDPL